jgi:hypothetical protein
MPLLLVSGLLLSALSACGDGGSVDLTITDDGGDTTQVEVTGFFGGLWDGFISPFTGIYSLFEPTEVYDDEADGSYPLGFGVGVALIGVILLGVIAGPRYYRRRT